MPVTFTYDFSLNPTISYVRLLISDTNPTAPIFGDDEITAAFQIQQMTFQSGMLYSGSSGQYLPSGPISYLRVAALLLDALAANKSRLMTLGVLDTKQDPMKCSDALRAQAKEYRDVDDNSGAFMLIEQCNTTWSFQDRFFKQIQRQLAQ